MHIVDLSTAPQHIPQLAAWHHEQWSYLNPGKTIEQRIEKLRDHLREGAVPRTFIAVDGDVLGSASLVAADMDTHPELTPWLASVFVSPLHRKRGVGAALVQRVMTAAEEAGIATLSLFTPDQEHFYRRLGWHTIAREFYRDAEVTLMQIDFRC
jgi:N-acetylglutamate synthase-like GNAT family acetyltransferase